MTDRHMHPLLQKVVKDREAQALKDIGWGLRDRVRAVGLLTMVAWDAVTGDIKQIQHGQNLVVNLGRSGLAHLLGDADPNRKVDRMQFGDGSTSPAVTDTGVSGSIILMNGGAQFKTVTRSYPDPFPGLDLKVQFEATVAQNEGNGAGTQIYREAALFEVGGDLFSRKVTGDITKDNTLVLTATWTIIF